jgi:magnesium-protoporphyrin O-methyltransferase
MGAHCRRRSSRCSTSARRKRALRRYRRRGPAKTTRALTEALRGANVSGATVIDIGGGVGAVSACADRGRRPGGHGRGRFLLLRRSRSRGGGAAGIAQQISFRQGDFVSLAAAIPEADVVTLDRVICCYPDVRALVSLSRRMPPAHTAWCFRATPGGPASDPIVNLFLFIMRNPMRTFVHGRDVVDDLLRSAGLSPLFERRFFFWQVAVWSRDRQNLPASIARSRRTDPAGQDRTRTAA